MARQSMRPSALPIVAAMLLFACTGAEPDPGVAVSSSAVSDTIAVTIQAPESLPAIEVELDSARVLWTPEELGRPNAMAVGPDGRITISDGHRLYAWQPGADTTENVGRTGSGPGEYRSISGLVTRPDGSLLALDWRQQRLLRFDPTGAPDSTWNIETQVTQTTFLALMDSEPVITTGRGIVHLGEPADTLYIRTADSASQELGHITLFVWTQAGAGVLIPRDAYPSLPRLAGSATAGFAFSDGLNYEIRWWRPGASPAWLHLTRAWSPPPQSIDREPPKELVDHLQMRGTMLKAIVNGEARGEHKYSLEDLMLMPGGTLWVRPVDSSYVYSPEYYAQLSELRQPTRLWEVFGRDGKLRAQVRLSSMFTPETAHDCQLYGFLEDSDGAFSVAVVPLGDQCDKLSRG